MSPLDVITLEQAKEFLVVDFPDRDAEITRHIKSAISYVEKYTNVMLYERDKTFIISGCSLEVYDYPITFISDPIRTESMVLSVIVFGTSGQQISTKIGYSDISQIPGDLIEAAYKIITYLFENRDIYTAGLPWDIQMLLNPYRRSATI